MGAVINKTVRSLIIQRLRTQNYWSVCIDLSIRTSTTKLENQESFIDILMPDITVHLMSVNKKLNKRLRNDRLDNQLIVKGKSHEAIDVRKVNNVQT